MKRLPVMIGGRLMVRDLKRRAARREAEAREAAAKRDHAKTYRAYEQYRLAAIVYHEVAQELETFADEYRFF